MLASILVPFEQEARMLDAVTAALLRLDRDVKAELQAHSETLNP